MTVSDNSFLIPIKDYIIGIIYQNNFIRASV